MRARPGSVGSEEVTGQWRRAPAANRSVQGCEARIIARRAVSSTRRRGARAHPDRCPASRTRMACAEPMTGPDARVSCRGTGAIPRQGRRVADPRPRPGIGDTFALEPPARCDDDEDPTPPCRSAARRRGRITLPETAGRHVTRVLRLRAGDALTVFDGRGGEYRATVARASRGAVEVEVGAHEPVDRESALAVELGQGICKGDRMTLWSRRRPSSACGPFAPSSANAPS